MNKSVSLILLTTQSIYIHRAIIYTEPLFYIEPFSFPEIWARHFLCWEFYGWPGVTWKTWMVWQPWIVWRSFTWHIMISLTWVHSVWWMVLRSSTWRGECRWQRLVAVRDILGVFTIANFCRALPCCLSNMRAMCATLRTYALWVSVRSNQPFVRSKEKTKYFAFLRKIHWLATTFVRTDQQFRD